MMRREVKLIITSEKSILYYDYHEFCRNDGWYCSKHHQLFVAAALYRKLLKVHLIFFDLIWSLQHCCLRWYYTGTVSIKLCDSVVVIFDFSDSYSSSSMMTLTISLKIKADFVCFCFLP